MTKVVTSMTIYDVDHYSDEERETIIASYPAHEREARAKGIPQLGSGRIYPVSEDEIKCEPFVIPEHWRFINGLDFGGWDHPTACSFLAYNPDNDCLYLYDTYKKKEGNAIIHAAAIKPRGDWIPIAWPHDGLQHDKGSGLEIRSQYREQGLNMLHEHATHESGGFGVEAGIQDLHDRMLTGRFKVFAHLNEWFDEFRLYHRKDGKIVKEFDDLLDSTRYGRMMLRFAQREPWDDDDYYEPPREVNPVTGY